MNSNILDETTACPTILSVIQYDGFRYLQEGWCGLPIYRREWQQDTEGRIISKPTEPKFSQFLFRYIPSQLTSTEAQVSQFLLGCKCPVSRGIVV